MGLTYQFDTSALDFVATDGTRFVTALEADRYCNPHLFGDRGPEPSKEIRA